jgi:V8-like Glu-specific endopeptidase
MFIQAIFICLVANVYLLESVEVVIGGVIRTKGVSIEAQNQRIRDFWTPEKLEAAKSLDVILPKIPHGRTAANHNVSNGPPSSVSGTMPSRLIRGINSDGRQVYTTGKVFFEGSNGGYYMCSAAIVSSDSGDLVVTAGHCVYDTDSQTWLSSNWVFIPAYSNGNRPYGTWPARSFATLTSWTNDRDFNNDVAFVALSTLDGQHIQHVLGSQGIGFNFARSEYTFAFGYPGNLDGGNYLKSCIGNAEDPIGTGDGYRGQRLWCDMGGGASGGPWLQGVDESNGVGYVTAVNSFILSSPSNYIFGPYFDSTIGSLYDSAKVN